MARDSDFFRRRADEARAAAFSKHDGDDAAVAGDLALAYAALAKRRAAAAAAAEVQTTEGPKAEPPLILGE
jgi:hypothetical protein